MKTATKKISILWFLKIAWANRCCSVYYQCLNLIQTEFNFQPLSIFMSLLILSHIFIL